MADANQGRNAFVVNLKAIMKDRHISQSDLADLVGMNKATISYWLSKRSMPNTNNMQSLADSLGVTVNDLVSSDSGYAAGGGCSTVCHRSFRPVKPSTVPRRRLGFAHAANPDEPFLDDGEVEVPETVVAKHPSLFVVGVHGECMNHGVANGTDVGVDPDMEPTNGAIALVLISGEVVVRRFFRGSSSVMLVSDSTEDYPDIILGPSDDFEVQGVVVWGQRDLERA